MRAVRLTECRPQVRRQAVDDRDRGVGGPFVILDVGGPQHSHGLEDFERTRLHTNGFRIRRRCSEWVDDAAVDSTPGQLDGCG